MKSCEHPDKPAAARCVSCGERLCYDCRVIRKGRNFCWACAPGKPAGFRSPTFSMILSLVPGLGQIYAGSYLKGLGFLISGGLLAGMGPFIPAVFLIGFWALSVWDARMSAHNRNHKVSKGHMGKSGATDGDWMMIFGTTGLAALYLGLPLFTNLSMAPEALWASFVVIIVLSAILGRGGKNVKQA